MAGGSSSIKLAKLNNYGHCGEKETLFVVACQGLVLNTLYGHCGGTES